MTEHRPLVLIDNTPTVLPPGDTLPGAGASNANNVVFQWDFLNANTNADIWSGGAVSGGQITGTTAVITNAKHPGVLRFNSVSGTANSGYRFTSGVSTTGIMPLITGSKFQAITNHVSNTNTISFIGFIDTTSAASPSNGAYFRVQEDQIYAVVAVGGSNTSVTLPSLTYGEWYVFEVVINGAASVTFTVYNDDGTVHGSTTTSTTVATVNIGCGIVAVNATSAPPNTNILYIDLLRLELKNLGRVP